MMEARISSGYVHIPRKGGVVCGDDRKVGQGKEGVSSVGHSVDGIFQQSKKDQRMKQLRIPYLANSLILESWSILKPQRY